MEDVKKLLQVEQEPLVEVEEDHLEDLQVVEEVEEEVGEEEEQLEPNYRML